MNILILSDETEAWRFGRTGAIRNSKLRNSEKLQSYRNSASDAKLSRIPLDQHTAQFPRTFLFLLVVRSMCVAFYPYIPIYQGTIYKHRERKKTRLPFLENYYCSDATDLLLII